MRVHMTDGHDMYHNGHFQLADGSLSAFVSEIGVTYPAEHLALSERLRAAELCMLEGPDWDGYVEDVVVYTSWTADVDIFDRDMDVTRVRVVGPDRDVAVRDCFECAIIDQIFNNVERGDY